MRQAVSTLAFRELEMRDPEVTPEALARLRRDGFVRLPGVMDAGDVSALRAAFDRLAEMAAGVDGVAMVRGAQFVVDQGEPIRIHRVVWCGAAEPVLSDYGRDPRLLSIAAAVLGSRELDQLINQAHFKRPGDGVAFPWHQDSRHRRYGTPEWTDVDGRGSFVQIAVALDPASDANGGLRFIPGSQALGHLPFDPETRALPPGTFDPSAAVTPALAPGDAVVFGPFVIHGSEPNQSDAPRRLFVNGYALPGANHRRYPGDGAGRRVVAPPGRGEDE